MHSFTQVATELLERPEVCEAENLIVVEYLNSACRYSSFALMQVNVNQWIMPVTISEEPSLGNIDTALLSIQRGRELATRMKLAPIEDAKKLLQLGSIVYNMIDAIVHDEY